MTEKPLLPAGTTIGRTALRVGELESMLEFYRDVVGLAVQTRGDHRATLGVDDTPLLELYRDETARPRAHAQAGLFHNAFALPSRAALGGALERVRADWRLDGASDHFVSEALYLTDPEDNGVELYVDKPKTVWPRRDDGTVEIGTVPLDLDTLLTQSDGSSEVPADTTVGHVHLEVTSLEAARAFYVDALGVTVQTSVSSALFLAAGDYHHHLGLNTWNGRTEPAGGRGLAWFEFVVPAGTLETVREHLAEADVSVTERGDGVELTDPDGTSVRIRTPS
ncbi:VOC family protein [Salinadaptatus halalkaliphilus]|uniref:VOC family protein n=1 Tax=Salinadaptatus halalkaliphilus TaxID=2419781 RepID=A0A4S3TTT7_9EURY|nr:VOC family protein [Salinadaptatus halalkaliphilus]THE66833.1 VOC family protein [Salinadaptatus halalkaliphilus]